jgi:uncharacterized protein YdhG (YjbR/CyaY superfamily)
MGSAPRSVDEYVAMFPPEEQAALNALRGAIQRAVPAAEEGISYGIIGYRYHGPLLYVSAAKQHYTVHAARVLDPALRKELDGFELTKGGVHLPKGKRLPLGLVGRLAKARARENLDKAAVRKVKRRKRT